MLRPYIVPGPFITPPAVALVAPAQNDLAAHDLDRAPARGNRAMDEIRPSATACSSGRPNASPRLSLRQVYSRAMR